MSQKPERDDELAPYSDPAKRVGMLRSLIENTTLTWRLFWDRRVNMLAKGVPLLSILYLLSPIDIISEVLVPVLGPLVLLDDVSLLIGAMALFIQLAPPDVVSEYRRALRSQGLDELDEGDVVEGEAEYIDD